MNLFFDYDIDKTDNKIIVYGVNDDAKSLACRLANKRIAVDGFLFPGDENIRQAHLLNKPITSFSNLVADNDYYIIVPYFIKKEAGKVLQAHKVPLDKIIYEKVDERVSKAERLFVYGSGCRTKDHLLKYFDVLKIDSFLDSDKSKQGNNIQGIPVIHPTAVEDNDKNNCIIIISSQYYHAMYQELIQSGFNCDNIYFYAISDVVLFKNSSDCINSEFLRSCIRISEGDAILYGKQDSVNEIVEVIRLFGINNFKCVTYQSAEESAIYNLAYEINSKSNVLVAGKSNIGQYNALLEIGFKDSQIWFADMTTIYYSANNFISYTYGLDPNIGFSKFDINGNPVGITTFEYHNNDSINGELIKILALGGSTTMTVGAREKSWVIYLHEYLKNKKIAHMIYCAGMESYAVSQELLKLIRDGLLLNPDICISYTGVNNKFISSLMENHMFVHTEQERVFHRLVKQSKAFGSNVAAAVDYGVKDTLLPYDFFISQLRLMFAACFEFGTKFFAFLQPEMYSKKNYYETDYDIMAYFGIFLTENGLICDDERTQKAVARSIDFRDKAAKTEKKYTYMHDLHNIFDDMDNIYLDQCHVCGKGNEIIAEKIYSIIEKDVFDIIKNSKAKEQ